MRALVILFVTACGGSTPQSSSIPGSSPTLVDPAPPPQFTCAEALESVVSYAPAALGKLFITHCEQDAWSIAARACFQRQPGSQPEPCMDELTNEQRKQFGEDVARTFPAE